MVNAAAHAQSWIGRDGERASGSGPEDIFTGPVVASTEDAADRYGRKPNGSSDQGYKED